MSETMTVNVISKFCLVKSQIAQIPHPHQPLYQDLLSVKAAKLKDV